MDLPPQIREFLETYTSRVWIRRGLLTATFAALLIYAYLFLTGLDPVPAEVRSVLHKAQERHLQHNHQKAIDHLTPFDRFEPYANTRLYDRARQLKRNAETVVQRQSKIRSTYREAMDHQVASEGTLSPSTVNQKLTALETKLDQLWKNHRDFLQKHPETSPPYSDVQESMRALLLHRLIRLKNKERPLFVRLSKYKTQVYSRLLDQCRKLVDRTPDTSYRNALDHLMSADDLLKNTLFQPQVEQLLRTLRTRIADHFDRINQKSRKLLKNNQHKKALKVFQNNRSHFKNIDPWERLLNHHIETLKKIKELTDS